MRSRVLVLSALFVFTLRAHGAEVVSDDILSITPQNGHSLFNDSIDQAKTSIDMMMYHLSDLETTQHLLAAQQRGVQVRLILDAKAMGTPSSTAIFNQLTASGVSVRASTPAFSISHAKAASFDNSWTLVTSINLTRTAPFTRDFGIKTTDSEVTAEFEKVFAADWENAQNKTGNTPELTVAKLAWSPLNSLDKILALIKKSQKSIYLEVENLGDKDVLSALEEKAQAGIQVVVVVPACVEGGGARNLPFMKELSSAGVDARLSVPPYNGQNPYIHAKSMVVDNQEFYVGSENFSYNSLTAARELGIIEANQKLSNTIQSTMLQDAQLATPVAQLVTTFSCASAQFATQITEPQTGSH
ncbi:phospholipase D-like domain-containing protein [Bdellovibrio svalbardensis]|uniref:Phospholipase D-like domain-containing protein n=1 Tax=Bdellovibrio svalbardensis TaxID=2972972 RepID=A0ABT6DGZ0_9BACT|nr:phospholipase D-like domain-containing protein [Bdellovibrio svalbardensis]MDG0816081.1 phospholipase D-like domain-containing protein [Bdellovibrio svalbardensis]